MWVLITVALFAAPDNKPHFWGPFTLAQCEITAEIFENAKTLCVPLRDEFNEE